MRTLEHDGIFQLSKAKTLEEFIVIKDMLDISCKKLSTAETASLLMCMAAQQHDAKVAKMLICNAEYISVNYAVWAKVCKWKNRGSFQKYIKGNLDEMLFEIEKRLMQEERAGSK